MQLCHIILKINMVFTPSLWSTIRILSTRRDHVFQILVVVLQHSTRIETISFSWDKIHPVWVIIQISHPNHTRRMCVFVCVCVITQKASNRRECATVNTWVRDKHGDQAAPLPGTSVYGPAFLETGTHTPWTPAHIQTYVVYICGEGQCVVWLLVVIMCLEIF